MLDTNVYNTKDFQQTLINFMISDETSFTRVQNIVDEAYFADHLRPVIRMIKEYAEKYNSVPTPELIRAETKYQAALIDGVQEHVDWFLDMTEQFCRHRALENIIHAGPDILAKGMGADLERQIKDAMTISLVSDLGTAFFDNVRQRIEARKDRSNYVSTGWETLDRKLGGGFTRGSLNIYAGGSGSGKSIFLQNQALNWVSLGLNTVYISLELSETLVNERLEAMMTQYATRDLIRNIDSVEFKIAKFKKGAITGQKVGNLHVKKFPEAGTTANTIRAYLKEYQIKTGLRPEALVIDYLDLMHPNNQKIDVSNLFTKDKYVSEEMRAIGGEWDIPVASASQLNRQSIDAQEFDHSHIAGGISKINTADNVFGIFTSMTMRNNGKYEVQFLKTRSAAATGQKLQLAYDVDCMRLSDIQELEDEPQQDNSALTQAAMTVAGTQSNVPWSTAPSTGMDSVNNLLDNLKLTGSSPSDDA